MSSPSSRNCSLALHFARFQNESNFLSTGIVAVILFLISIAFLQKLPSCGENAWQTTPGARSASLHAIHPIQGQNDHHRAQPLIRLRTKLLIHSLMENVLCPVFERYPIAAFHILELGTLKHVLSQIRFQTQPETLLGDWNFEWSKWIPTGESGG